MMKLEFKLWLILCFLISSLQAQVVKPLVEEKWPESDPDAKYYTVKGYRHGVSFFPKVQYSEVEYTPSPTLTFDRYHSADVVYHWMKTWTEKYPNLLDMYEVARSYEGRPIYQLTLTNKAAGKATDKPAAYFEGGRHSGEVTAVESMMWLLKYLLENYGKNQQITKMIDKNAIYMRPINNPDGHNLYMHTAQSNRSSVRPVDNDGDGLLDEDSPEDLDGDGHILQMRFKDPEGTYIIDPRDPAGRLMKRAESGKGEYAIYSEGIDNDSDGTYNEDGIGGLDLHRNYAENWRPEREATGRGWTQGGAGEYPLSETETRSVVTFLLSNPNVYIVNSMDTSVPMHLRPPSTAPSSAMFPEDLQWYTTFDSIGKSITGYERAGDVYLDYSGGAGSPLFGHGPDFGYWYYGAVWYGDEIWNTGRATKDYNGDGEIDDLDRLIMNDQEYGGKAFFNWKPFRHPQLGEVEIGGWNPKFFTQNSPAVVLEKWAKNEALFNLEMLKYLPELKWEGIEVRKMEAYQQDSADYQIKITYRNVGKLPTAFTQADLVKIVRQDQVKLSLPKSAVEGEKPKAKILPDAEARPQGRQRAGSNVGETIRNAGYAQGGSVNSKTVMVRVYGNQQIEGTASVSTTRAGILPEKSFVIK